MHHSHHLLGIGLGYPALAVKDGDQLRWRDLLKVQLNEPVPECSGQELDTGSVGWMWSHRQPIVGMYSMCSTLICYMCTVHSIKCCIVYIRTYVNGIYCIVHV